MVSLPQQNMAANYTYQDTITGRNLIETLPVNKSIEHNLQRQRPQSLTSFERRDTVVPKQEKKTYTATQIRQWRLNQENKLLIDSSKYIQARQQHDLNTEQLSIPKVVLPNRERDNSNSDWLTIVIFLAIILFATIRYTYAKYIQHLFLSLLNYATTARMLNDKNYPVFHAAYRLDVIFYLLFATLIYQCLNLFKWENAMLNPQYFAFVFGAVLLYFFGKKLIYTVLGLLFETQNETREYLFNMDNFNRSLSIVLLPIVVLVAYAPLQTPLFIALSGIVILCIFNLMLLRRGIIILLKKQFSLYYLFLYLCTLEILPLLLIYKVVV